MSKDLLLLEAVSVMESLLNRLILRVTLTLVNRDSDVRWKVSLAVYERVDYCLPALTYSYCLLFAGKMTSLDFAYLEDLESKDSEFSTVRS